jgi:hypothetical protein
LAAASAAAAFSSASAFLASSFAFAASIVCLLLVNQQFGLPYNINTAEGSTSKSSRKGRTTGYKDHSRRSDTMTPLPLPLLLQLPLPLPLLSLMHYVAVVLLPSLLVPSSLLRPAVLLLFFSLLLWFLFI